MAYKKEEGPRLVEVPDGSHLRPGDQVREGLFVRTLHYTGHHWSQPYDWDVAPAHRVAVKMQDGRELMRTEWDLPVEMPMEFPMTVVRGLAPPLRLENTEEWVAPPEPPGGV